MGRVRAAAAIGWLTIPGNALLVAILAAAAFVRFWALNFGLPHPAARPDEEAIGALAGSYLSGTFRPTDFTYPPLFPLLVALASWLSFWRLPATLRAFGLPFEPGDPTTSAQRILARVLGAAAGVFSVWLLFRIARRLFGDRTALVAAAFLALAFLHVRDSHFGVTDVPMTCMVLAGFLAILKMSESGTRRDLLIAGICTGLAVATKYNAGLLALPACYAILAGPGPFSMAHRVGRAAAFVAIMTCTFLIVCPFALIDYRTFVEDLIEVGRHLREGHGPDLGRGWIHHLTITLRYGSRPALAHRRHCGPGVDGVARRLSRRPRDGLSGRVLRGQRKRADGLRAARAAARAVPVLVGCLSGVNRRERSGEPSSPAPVACRRCGGSHGAGAASVGVVDRRVQPRDSARG